MKLKVYESFAGTIEEARREDISPGEFESIQEFIDAFTLMADGTSMEWPGLNEDEIDECLAFAASDRTAMFLSDDVVGTWIEKIT